MTNADILLRRASDLVAQADAINARAQAAIARAMADLKESTLLSDKADLLIAQAKRAME